MLYCIDERSSARIAGSRTPSPVRIVPIGAGLALNPGGGNKQIRDQPHALEPTLSKEIELGPESVGRLSICENHNCNRASH